MTQTEEYEPETQALTRPSDVDLDSKLTGKPAVESLAEALRQAAFTFEPEDLMTVAMAESLVIEDEDAYVRGYDLLSELGDIQDKIAAHYSRFDKPLNFLARVVRSLKGPQVKTVEPVKASLSKKLGAYKAEEERKAAEQRRLEQEAKDREAKLAQQAKAAALERVAEAEPNPALAESFRQEATMVREADVRAAPVQARPSVPSVAGGYTTQRWACEFVDVKALLKAHVEGRCFLDETAIIAGLQSAMDKQAAALQHNLGRAFPGTRAVPQYGAVARRRR